MYSIHLGKRALKDIAKLRKENAKYAAKLWDLILDIQRDPFDGLGEPEPLKGDYQGYWSRRITQEHRLIYRVEAGELEITACHGHYDDK
jgi:toxin YoeB